MSLLKRLLAHFKNKSPEEYNVPVQEWNSFGGRISFYTKSFMSNYEPTF